jgi:cytochrome c553
LADSTETTEMGLRAIASACLVLLACQAYSAGETLGERIYGAECVRCHGEQGQGGNDGDYPRLAGMPASYLALQLSSFLAGKRANKPMLPIFEEGRLRTEQVAAVSAYLSELPAPTAGDVGVPERIDGDLELGRELYEKDCALCHGFDGRGKEESENPPVVQQYPRYLAKQLGDFREGRRWHEYAEPMFVEPESEDLDALLAYMLSLNSGPPSTP